MKKVLLIVGAAALLISCKDNPIVSKVKETKQNVENTTNAYKEVFNAQEDIEKLSKVTPMTNEELKAWLPDEVDGMKRTSFKAGAMAAMNIASIEATYTSEDQSKEFKVEIIDGAGEVGAMAIIGMRMALSQEFEEETEYKIKKTTKKGGVKAIEESYKDGSSSNVEFLQDDRFYIKASGRNMSINELWDLIDEIDSDDLG